MNEQTEEPTGDGAPPKKSKHKPKSRAARWAEAAANASLALSDLQEMQGEFQDWYDNMNENLQQGTTGEMLQAICDLDISSEHRRIFNQCRGATLGVEKEGKP